MRTSLEQIRANAPVSPRWSLPDAFTPTHLFKPDRAEKLLKEAAASPTPHSDLDAAIQEGLKQCATAAATPGSYGR